jgi:hypothetical protein
MGRRLLVSAAADNIVFRHEIGMDSFGRLRAGSPIYAAHLSMAAWFIASGIMLALAGPRAAALLLAGPMLGLTVGAYPFAAWRAYRNLRDERSSGALDQLYLTRLRPEELFEGKLYGLLGPLLEARRWLTPLGLLFGWSVFRAAPGPWFLLALVAWMTALNHFGHSVVVGTIAGLKWAAVGRATAGAIVRDWRLNPWPLHAWLLAKAGALIALPVLFLVWLGRNSDAPLYPAFALMLTMPFYAAVYLGERQRAERERLAFGFRGMFRIEGQGDPRSVNPDRETRTSAGVQ